MTDPTPIDPARVLAALEVLGWPDDRGEQYAEDSAVMPAEAHYRLAEDVIRAVDAAGCPCVPGAPEHRHGVGGYAPDASPDNPAPVPADPEAASRVITAAEALERRLWTRGLTEDDLTPEHRELIHALAAYNSQPDTDIGWPPPGHEPPTAAEWHEPEGV